MATVADTEREYLRTKAKALLTAKHGEKSQILNGIQEFLGIDRKTAYRRLAEVGYQSERKQRKDAGESVLTKDHCTLISNIIVQSIRNNDKQGAGIQDVLDDLEANDKIPKVSLSTASRMMKHYGVHPEQLNKPSPHQSMRSLHPNHVHQFDVSVCVMFYLNKGGIALMDEKEFYKNKPDNVARISKQRLLRYLLTDHYSSAFYLRYFNASGEDQETLFKFLMSAWGAERNEYSLLHGVPKILIWDKGSANQSFMIKNLLNHLGVKHIAHTAHNPRAKGQVERTHDIVERKFESRLFRMKIDTLDELNESAWEWMRKFNSVDKCRSRNNHSRYGLWQTIKAEQLRLCPPKEICQQLLSSKPIEKTVKGGLNISHAIKGYPSMDYRLHTIPDIYVGQKVEITVNPYRAPNIDVLIGDQRYEIEPIITNEQGFFDMSSPVWGEEFKSLNDTPMDTMRKSMLKAAYGVETQAEADKAKSKRKPAFEGLDPMADVKKAQLPNFMEKKGQPLEVAVPSVELKPLSIVEALISVKTKLGRNLTPAENKEVRSWYPSKEVPPNEIDNIVAALSHSGEVRAIG